MHQFLNNNLLTSFINTWILPAERRILHGGPILRNDDNVYVPKSCLILTEWHPLIYFPKAWNDLSAVGIRQIVDKLTFNRALKKNTF
jgi:hypothetical protein